MATMGKVTLGDSTKLLNNIISNEKLKDIQKRVLDDLKNAIIPSMGPAGSNTLIIRGSNDQDIVAEYSKDGNKIIKHIKYQYPIEMSIKSEIENATRHIEKTVGDGTSSVVVMSSNIFNALYDADNNMELPANPYETIRIFKECVKELSDEIRNRGRECTLDDIYSITLISTNGNKDLAEQMRDIYEEYGMDVFIDVSASSDENTYVKSYDGVTLEAGYADPCMINNLERNSARIRSLKGNPVRVYQFQDPIDDAEMNTLFMQIIESNIIGPYSQNRTYIPTVILAPIIGRDTQAYMRRVTQFMHNFPPEAYSQKPELLIVTNYSGLDENYVDHISQLCDAKPIRKYIDEDQQKADQEAGLAPTVDTVCEFCGFCGEVEADANITKFIDPCDMYEIGDDGTFVMDEDNHRKFSTKYNNIITFLEAELKNAQMTGGHAGVVGSLKRQLNAVKANMIELFVGGISISDRDSLRDLVEDAVLNCRSAAKNGVGYGANTLGFTILSEKMENYTYDIDKYNMYLILHNAYCDILQSLYSTMFSKDDVLEIMNNISKNGGIPMNMNTGKYDGLVLTSIESEPAILDTIAKIITIMFTSNQALVQAPNLSQYY